MRVRELKAILALVKDEDLPVIFDPNNGNPVISEDASFLIKASLYVHPGKTREGEVCTDKNSDPFCVMISPIEKS